VICGGAAAKNPAPPLLGGNGASKVMVF